MAIQNKDIQSAHTLRIMASRYLPHRRNSTTVTSLSSFDHPPCVLHPLSFPPSWLLPSELEPKTTGALMLQSPPLGVLPRSLVGVLLLPLLRGPLHPTLLKSPRLPELSAPGVSRELADSDDITVIDRMFACRADIDHYDCAAAGSSEESSSESDGSNCIIHGESACWMPDPGIGRLMNLRIHQSAIITETVLPSSLRIVTRPRLPTTTNRCTLAPSSSSSSLRPLEWSSP